MLIMKMNWCKWRSHYSYGTGNWHYIHVRVMPQQIEWIRRYLATTNLLNIWSEHFRKVEIKKVAPNKVPKDIIQNEIKEIESIKGKTKELIILLNSQKS